MKHHQEAPPSSAPFPSPDAKIRIIIADDHALFNEGVRGLLASEPGYEVVEQVYDGNHVLDAVQRHQPQLLLLDINLPGTDGLQIAERLTSKTNRPKIVLLSMYNDAFFIEKAKDLQLEGYLLKTASKQELLYCLAEINAGQTYYNPEAKKENLHRDDVFLKKYKLTSREKEIIGLIRKGLSSQQIADAIYLSVLTVETHRRNINLKLGVKSPVELIRRAQEIGL